MFVFATATILLLASGQGDQNDDEDRRRGQLFNSKELGSTAWGDWGETWYCPKGHHATGFKTRIEKYQYGKDDTALNSFRLLCSNDRLSKAEKKQSLEGEYGDWQEANRCPEDSFLTGLKMFYEPKQGDGEDDTAANNVWGYCTTADGGTKTELKNEFISYAPKHEGNPLWDIKMMEDKCPPKSAIIGFRSRVEGERGGSTDDTSLNRIQFVCETHPECTYIEITEMSPDKTGSGALAIDEARKGMQPKMVNVGEQDNCAHGSALAWKATTSVDHVSEVWDTYQVDKSWSKSMKQSISSEVTTEWEASFKAGYTSGSRTWTYSANKGNSWTKTQSGSTTKATRKISITTNKIKSDDSNIVKAWRKWRMKNTWEQFTRTFHWSAKAQCYTKKGGDKVGKAQKITGDYTGFSTTKEEFETTDVTDTCPNRMGKESGWKTCECAGVYSSTGVGGEECTKPEDFKLPEKTKGRGPAWCYVMKGACENANTVTYDLDKGLRSDDFEWSTDPCTKKKAGRRRESEELPAQAPGTVEFDEFSLYNPNFVQPKTETGALIGVPDVDAENRRRIALPKVEPPARPVDSNKWPNYRKDECSCVDANNPKQNAVSCFKSGPYVCEDFEQCTSDKRVPASDWKKLCKVGGKDQCVDDSRNLNDQCGGRNFGGSDCCPSGTYCQWNSDWWAQCRAGPCIKGWMCNEPKWSIDEKERKLRAAFTAAPTSAPTDSPTPKPTPSPTNKPTPSPTNKPGSLPTPIVGYYSWSWGNGSNGPAGANLGAAFTGHADVSKALSGWKYAKSPALKGTKFLTLGGGNDLGKWTETRLNLLSETTIAEIKKAGYGGVVFDVEQTEGGSAKLIPLFRTAFANLKASGLLVGVTVSHSAPYKCATPADAVAYVKAFVQDKNVDIISPQLYSNGNEASPEFAETWACKAAGCTWDLYKNAQAVVAPSIVDPTHYQKSVDFFKTNGVELGGYLVWKQM